MSKLLAPERPALLTLEETAEWLKVRPERLRRLLRNGSVPGGTRVGHTWRVDASRVEEMLRSGSAIQD
jgi:excisionase family DNA binding protein